MVTNILFCSTQLFGFFFLYNFTTWMCLNCCTIKIHVKTVASF